MLIHIKLDTDQGTVDISTQTPSGERANATYPLPTPRPIAISESESGNSFTQEKGPPSISSEPNGASESITVEVTPPASRRPSHQTPEFVKQPNKETIETARRFYKELCDLLVALLQGVVSKKRIQLDPILSLVDRVVAGDGLLDTLYSLAVQNRNADNALSVHMVNVATYAVKVGKALGYDFEKLKQLALASMLHDVGMCATPSDLRHKKDKLNFQELAVIRRHPDYGYHVIKAHLGDDFDWLGRLVHQEHERENGNGYPLGLPGDKIDEMAKVISIADVYEALTSDRPHRPRMRPNNAIKEIMVGHSGQFPPRILKAMLQQLSIYPLDSLVRLNTNVIARVVETHEGKPMRPTVQTMFDNNGEYVQDGPRFSLLENPLVYIVDSVDESKLASEKGVH
jgi:HD-GYP domain-containing protein (c-di-GMP phosphodiesterase class II)